MTRAKLVRIGSFVLLLAAWEAVCREGLVNQIILAPPSDIVAAAFSGWQRFLAAFQVTILSIFASIALAWLIGLGFGICVGLSPFANSVFSPLLTGLFSVPLITLYPMFLVWFGIGPGSKIAFATLTGAIPIALNAMAGARQIDRDYILFARSVGASPVQAYFRVYFPLSLPSILSGLRVGTSLVVISVVVCEMLASVDGLGFWISYNRTLFKTGDVYLGIALAVSAVMVVNAGLGRIERRFTVSDAEAVRA